MRTGQINASLQSSNQEAEAAKSTVQRQFGLYSKTVKTKRNKEGE